MPDLATLQARLDEAESAYHRLMTGSLEESIGLGDMQVRYTRAEADKLAAYISLLRADVSAAGGSGTGSRRRAITVSLGGLA
jgi:hypothetical protein